MSLSRQSRDVVFYALLAVTTLVFLGNADYTQLLLLWATGGSLAILTAIYFRNRGSIAVDDINLMKG